MEMRIDDKGKYFTPRVAKDSLPALIRTVDQIIVGEVHIRPERRLKDDLGDDRSRFLAVTDARVYAAADETLLYHSSFLLVAYQHIVTLSPLDALKNVRAAAWAEERDQEETV